MNLTYHIADPAGNVTIMVTSPVDRHDYAEISRKLIDTIDNAEQVGFLTEPCFGGDIRLEMMGGEFCGNAVRCAALYYAKKQEQWNAGYVKTEISGCDCVLEVWVNDDTTEAEAEMPLPVDTDIAMLWKTRIADAVIFDGIVHCVSYQDHSDIKPAWLKESLRSLAIQYRTSAVGLIQLDKEKMEMTPIVYVVSTDTMIYESSCASGSEAVAICLAEDETDGTYVYDLKEPGGMLRVSAKKEQGTVTSVKIGGNIALSDEKEIVLE
ncbi:MAG: hypothetical protein IJO94_00105 [Firmicutes bacterium]|nr:hypothetical protein [Bacillota bacterium]MBQ4093390.1 hypothetical protein [Bacillota bacterium]MBQ6809788.1 hypothetical protein [Bacillota bacterium]